MICSGCGHDVDEYRRGRQCSLCVAKVLKAWRKRNKQKQYDSAKAWRLDNPERFRKSVRNSYAKRRVLYNIHSKLKCRYELKHLTDVYIRKLVRKTPSNVNYIVTDQQIQERREWIILVRQEKQKRKEAAARKLMPVCSLVDKEIPAETCRNMQMNYKYEDCSICEYRSVQTAFTGGRQ